MIQATTILAFMCDLREIPSAMIPAVSRWWPRTVLISSSTHHSPMPFTPVPGVKQVGEAVIDEARDRPHDWVAEERRQPALARRRAPDRDRDVGADDEAALFIRGVEPATDILERGAVGRERPRLQIDVAEFDRSRF